jgi:hypothetical protein
MRSVNGKHDSFQKSGQMKTVTTPNGENQVKEDVNAQRATWTEEEQ